jgi:hypothetical protein
MSQNIEIINIAMRLIVKATVLAAGFSRGVHKLNIRKIFQINYLSVFRMKSLAKR